MKRLVVKENGTFIEGPDLLVADVLRWLGSGQTEQEILERYPGLTRDDFLAVYNFSASCIMAASSVSKTFARIRDDINQKLKAVKTDQERNAN
jgi:hypothetical protein